MSTYDLYLRQLRSLIKTVSQEGSQSNEDNRSVEVQTDEIETDSKGGQFQFGDDDTMLVNILAALKNGDGLAKFTEFHHQDASSSVASQATLAHFLRHATPVFFAEKHLALFVHLSQLFTFGSFLTIQAVEALLMEGEAKAVEKDALRNPSKEAPRLFQDERWTPLEHSVPGASHSIHCSCQVLASFEHCNLRHATPFEIEVLILLFSGVIHACVAQINHRAAPREELHCGLGPDEALPLEQPGG